MDGAATCVVRLKMLVLTVFGLPRFWKNIVEPGAQRQETLRYAVTRNWSARRSGQIAGDLGCAGSRETSKFVDAPIFYMTVTKPWRRFYFVI